MKQITNLTDAIRQSYIVPLETGGSVTLQLFYYEVTNAWYYSIIYGKNGYTILNKKLTLNLNLLSNYREILPFGLQCLAYNDKSDLGDSISTVEPFRQDDFVTGRIQLYTLSKPDVDALVSFG